MRRVRAIGNEPLALHLSAKGRQALASATEAWRSSAIDALPPLFDYSQGLPDLAVRLAADLHLAAAAGSASSPDREIPLASVKHALRMIDTFVMPMATGVLGPISRPEVERDARRVIDFLWQTTSSVDRVFERRVLVRAWQRSMNVRRLDAALGLLQEAALLVALDKGRGAGGQRLEVNTAPCSVAPETVNTPPPPAGRTDRRGGR